MRLEFFHHSISIIKKSKAFKLCPKTSIEKRLYINFSCLINIPKIKRTTENTKIFAIKDLIGEITLIFDFNSGFSLIIL